MTKLQEQQPGVRTIILNGWAAREEAWDKCRFARDAVFSYTDHIDGVTLSAFDSAEKVSIAAWSMGGTYALSLALRNPAKIKKMLLLAATPRMTRDEETSWPGMSPRRVKALELGLKMTLDTSALHHEAYFLDSEKNLERGLDYLRNTDLRKELIERRNEFANIEVEIFNSEKDPIVRKEHAEFLASVFPSSRLEIVPGADHALPLIIADKIDEFFIR